MSEDATVARATRFADVSRVSPALPRPRWAIALHWALLTPAFLGVVVTGWLLALAPAGFSAPNSGLVVLHALSAAGLIVGLLLWLYGSLMHRGRESLEELLPTLANLGAGVVAMVAYWRKGRDIPAYTVHDPAQVVLYWKLPVLLLLAAVSGYALWSPDGTWAAGLSALTGIPYGPFILHVVFGVLLVPWLLVHVYLGVMRSLFGHRSLGSIFRSDL